MRLTRLTGTVLPASAVAVGSALVASVLVGRDKARGEKPRLPDHPAPYSAEERAASVRAYLTAIERPAAAFAVPFAPDCVRVENGLRTGFGGEQMHWDLHLHLQYTAIRRIGNICLEVDPDGREGVVHAEFDIETVLGLGVHVSEDFEVPADDCLIHRIEARITRSGYRVPSDRANG